MSSSIDSENDCKSFFDETVPLRYSSDADSLYGLLVAAAVLSLAACPFTILLNALVMVAVKTKRRLQTHPNILLACLALTDLLVGLVVQPLHITKTIFLLQGKDFHEFCKIDFSFTISFVISCFASFFHLFLISGERYLAVKHGFSHANVVTKTRLMLSSSVAWIAAVFFLLVASYSRVVAFGFITATFSSIIVLQILVYNEARRHEQQILSLQDSEEARAKLKKEMKALKLTTIVILVKLCLCFFLPLFILFVTWQIFTNISPDVKTLVRHFSLLLGIINSVINPVIYTVRKRDFRVSFIDLLLKKSLQEAEELDRQEGEGQEQNAEERSQVHTDDNGAKFDDNTNLASQNEAVFSNARNSTSTKRGEEHGGVRYPAHPENQQEDNARVFTCGANVDDDANLATWNEPVSSNAFNSTFKKTEGGDGDGRNPAHANGNIEDIRGDLAYGGNFDVNTNFASQNEHISSNEFNSQLKKAEVENDERRNPSHANNMRECNSEVIASGAKFDENIDLASEN